MRHLLIGGALAAAAGMPVLAVGAEHGDGGGGGLGEALVAPNPGIFIWTLVTFILVLFVLRRFAWGPLLGALETREKSIRDTLEQAQNDRDEAAKLLEEHKTLLADARRERQEASERGQREAERMKEEILGDARSQRDQMLKQTQEQVDVAMRQAKAEMRGLVVDLSIQAAEKLMAKNLDDGTQRKLVEDYLADLDNASGSRPTA